jgi:hypothetical protein
VTLDETSEPALSKAYAVSLTHAVATMDDTQMLNARRRNASGLESGRLADRILLAVRLRLNYRYIKCFRDRNTILPEMSEIDC